MSLHTLPAQLCSLLRLRIRCPAALGAVLVVATVIAVASPAIAEEQKTPPLGLAAPEDPAVSKESTAAKPTEERPTITFKDGKLTVQLRNRPLTWVLQEISREARLAIVIPEELVEESISAQVKDLPVDQVLRQILTNYDTFFFYGAMKDASAALNVVWVYPKGEGQRYIPEPAETWASTRELADEARGNPDAEARARAIATLVERKGAEALDIVLDALQDPDDGVRTEALYAAFKGDLRIPVGTLTNIALWDRSPSMRFLALDSLAGDSYALPAFDLTVVATYGLNDSSPHVQKKAEEILRRLGTPSQAPGDPVRIPSQQKGR